RKRNSSRSGYSKSMKRVGKLILIFTTAFPLVAPAQVPDAQSQQQPAQPGPAAKSENSPTSKFLGKDVPLFDPANEIVAWDGHAWNLNNNRVFEARFEKYLNAPEETNQQSQEYQNILRTILDKLAPENFSTKAVDEAFRLLPRASNFDIDA